MLTLAQAEQFVQKVCMDHRLPAPRITRHTAGTLRRGAKSLHLGHGITREVLRDQLAFYLYSKLSAKKRAVAGSRSSIQWRRWVENQIEKEFPLRAARPRAVAGAEQQRQTP